MAVAFSRTMLLDYKRVQFTPDVLPSDLTGFSIYRREERKVTVEGVTREVPAPFLVIATQNPSGSAGTQQLPEAQMDRFMVELSIGYPDFESELAMGITDKNRLEGLSPVMNGEQLLNIQREVSRVYIIRQGKP